MRLSKSLRTSLEYATQTYQGQLDLGAVEYLRARGIEKQTAQRYRLGVVREPLEGDSEYTGCLTIPYITTGGVVDIRYRQMDPDRSPKYLSRHGAKGRLYSVVSLLAETSSIAICEGEFDTMTLNQAGIPAVGVPGANSWQAHWSLLFDDFEKIIVCCDGDQAGKDFGSRMVERFDMQQVKLVNFPAGADVNSFMLEHGTVVLREKVGE